MYPGTTLYVKGSQYLVYCVFIPAAFLEGLDDICLSVGELALVMLKCASKLDANDGTTVGNNQRGHKTSGFMALSGAHHGQYITSEEDNLQRYPAKGELATAAMQAKQKALVQQVDAL